MEESLRHMGAAELVRILEQRLEQEMAAKRRQETIRNASLRTPWRRRIRSRRPSWTRRTGNWERPARRGAGWTSTAYSPPPWSARWTPLPRSTPRLSEPYAASQSSKGWRPRRERTAWRKETTMTTPPDDPQFHTMTPRQRAAWHLRRAAEILEGLSHDDAPVDEDAEAPARHYRDVCQQCGVPVYPGVERCTDCSEGA